MKWTNRGHEFDGYVDEIFQEGSFRSRYYIFGAGALGREMLDILRNCGCDAEAFIDNDPAKQGSKINGTSVISLENYLRKNDGLILVTPAGENGQKIIELLDAFSLREGTDYCRAEKFINSVLPIVSVYLHDRAFVPTIQISLTERCTLKCRKCAHACFAVDNRTVEDMPLEMVFQSADAFFSKADFVRDFVLIGGEPLLYQRLPEAISYIGERYRKQIGKLYITTNGTVLPNEDVLKMCKKYDLIVNISNYSAELPHLKDHYKRLTGLLERNGVECLLGKEDRIWMDYGFDFVDRRGTPEELIQVFDACKTPCREVRGNRLYYCVMARSVSENLGFHVGQDDYLDLTALTGENGKKVLTEFTLGYSQKGYLDMCNHCNGAEAQNYPIPAAEQLS